METSHVLGMICGYLLSRLDSEAYSHFGFPTQQATHEFLGATLGVPAESIKNWRDEFDPVHPNARLGWHRRPMYPSRIRTIELLGELPDLDLYTLVDTILDDPLGPHAIGIARLARGESDEVRETTLALRGPTGVGAEEAFRQHSALTGEPVAGTLRDCRQEACGYDFKITAGPDTSVVEVKGLAGDKGGVTFTNKEWRVARQMGSSYYLAIVRNVATEPQVDVIRDPSMKLDAAMRAYTTVQIGWSVSGASLREVLASIR